jgi:hypothetical protein
MLGYAAKRSKMLNYGNSLIRCGLHKEMKSKNGFNENEKAMSNQYRGAVPGNRDGARAEHADVPRQFWQDGRHRN